MKVNIAIRPGIILLIIFSLSFNGLFAGNNDEPDVRDMSFRERLFAGGSLGFSISDYATFVDVSPIMGFRITNRISAGVGLNYHYYHERVMGRGTHIYGGKTFARVLIIPQVFVYGEYEMLNLESLYFGVNNNNRFWEKNYFLGAGYRQQIGPKAFFNIMALYNFNDNSSVYFQNPLLRFSIEVGL